jgi:hypothetical protein
MMLFRIGQIILTGTLLATLAAVVFNYPDHIFGPWELHARVHIYQAVLWVSGLCILGLIIALKFLSKEKWAHLALLFIGLILYTGFFLPHAITPNPLNEPADSDGWAGFGAFTITYITGLILTNFAKHHK